MKKRDTLEKEIKICSSRNITEKKSNDKWQERYTWKEKIMIRDNDTHEKKK